jgi:hypothetical protein
VYRIHGEDYLSTSTVLRIMRWGDLGHVDPYALAYGQQRGSYVDQACQCYEQGCLGEVEPALQGYVEAWSKFKQRELWEHSGTETLVVRCPSYTFGYRDRYGWYEGRSTVLDIKTSDFIGTGYRLQLASYLGDLKHAAVVQLKQDGTYALHGLDDPYAWCRRWDAVAKEAHAYIREEEEREQFYLEKRRARRRE